MSLATRTGAPPLAGDAVDAGIVRPARRGQVAAAAAARRRSCGRRARSAGAHNGRAGWSRRAPCRRAPRRCGSGRGRRRSRRRRRSASVARPGREQLERAARLPLVSRRAAPPAAGLSHNLPRLSNTTWRPSGETSAKRGILVVKRSGATSTCGCGASIDDARVVDLGTGFRARAPLVGVDPADLAAGPEDDAAAVGRPVHVRIDAVHRPGLLHVLVERVVDLALLARWRGP